MSYDEDWTLQEQLTAINETLDRFGAETGPLPHERLIKLAVKLASRADMPWEYRITQERVPSLETLDSLTPTPPEGKGWSLISTSALPHTRLGNYYVCLFTWKRK